MKLLKEKKIIIYTPFVFHISYLFFLLRILYEIINKNDTLLIYSLRIVFAILQILFIFLRTIYYYCNENKNKNII